MMNENKLFNTRKLLTWALVLNTIAWFIPDLFFPESHFRSNTWHLHARLHVGAAATVNMVYIILGLWMIWKPQFDLRQTMRWVAGGLAIWNIVVMLFFMITLPFIMEEGDKYISWTLDPKGAGSEHGTGLEGMVFVMAGVPTILFLWVLRRLRIE